MKQLIVLAFLISFVAMAQTTKILQPPSYTFTKASCVDPTAISGISINNSNGAHVVAMTGSGQSSTATCGTYTYNAAAPLLPNVEVNDTGNLTGLRIMDLMPQTACSTDAGVNNSPNWQYLCLYNSGDTSKLVVSFSYQYDTTPYKITILSTTLGDAQVTLNINDSKNTGTTQVSYQACYTRLDANTLAANLECSNKDGNFHSFVGHNLATTTDPKINDGKPYVSFVIDKDLTNGTPYVFKARAIDGNGTGISAWTDVTEALKPVPTNTYAELYDGYPNWSMNCSSGSTSPSAFALWGFLGFILLGLRKRSSSTLLLIMLIATPSLARLGQVSVGITGSPYLPNIDASLFQPGARTGDPTRTGFFPIYKCMYDDKILPLMGLHVDTHLFDNFGSLRVGLGAAYTYASGHGIGNNSAGKIPSEADGCGTKTDSPAGLHILHIRPQLTYVLDTWIDSFPIAPYVKVGLVGAGYLATSQGKPDKPEQAEVDAGLINPAAKNLGMVFGWVAAAGLMLSLDWIEPMTSANARGLGTYDHTFLTFEAAYMPINNFTGKGLNLSNAWPTKNFPLSLTASLVVEFQ